MSFDWPLQLSSDHRFTLRPPADECDLHRAESSLAARFSADLRDLYLTSDGVFDELGQWFVVWSLTKVVLNNQADWENAAAGSMRDDLIGFGDDGTGAPFCIPRSGTGEVVIWNPITQEVIPLAETVTDFWTRLCAGTLPRY